MAENDKITTNTPMPEDNKNGTINVLGPSGVKVRHLNEQEQKFWSRAIHFATSEGMLPALRAAYAHLMPFIDENCPTAYTDCRYRIGLAPWLFDISDTEEGHKSSIYKLALTMIHETLHNTQHHRQRLLEKRGLDSMVTNFATDLEINGNLTAGLANISFNEIPVNEDINNGNWDWFIGDYKQLSKEEAEELNNRKTDNGDFILGKKYESGDWCYQGMLIPGHGEFHSFPTDATAEQYLGLLEVETVEMSFAEFQKERDEALGQNGNDNNQEQSSGQKQQDAQGQSDEQEQSDGQGQSNGQNGENSQQGNNSSGSSGIGDDAGTDGWGGQGKFTGNERVQVKKIYRTNPDGSKTRVGQRAFVDNIDAMDDADVWKEVSEKLGLNPINRSEEQKVRDQISHDIEEQRRSNAYGSGHCGSLLNYIAKGLRPPIINWKRVFRTATARATEQMRKGRDDYSYKRISRRRNESEFIFPGMISYIPTIRFALDTSGSMSQQEYFNALSEAEGILRETKANLEVCCVDTEASKVRKVRSVKEITKELVGGGGTDMAAATKQVASESSKSRPDVLVIATDGCFDWSELARSLADPKLKNTAVIVLVVYRFTEDAYFAKQGEIKTYQNMLRKYSNKAQVLQAFVKGVGMD